MGQEVHQQGANSQGVRPRDFHAAALIASGAPRGVIAKELGMHPVSVSRLKRRPEVRALVEALLAQIGRRVIEEEAMRIHRAAGRSSAKSSSPSGKKLDVNRVLRSYPDVLSAWRTKPSAPGPVTRSNTIRTQPRPSVEATNSGADQLEEE